MNKTVFITGATDGIGLATAKTFAKEGHNLILHGKTVKKLEDTKITLQEITPTLNIDTFVADFSSIKEVSDMADSILSKIKKIDILINNAGVFVVSDNDVITIDNLDIRFSVNTIAPYILTKKLLPILNADSRVVNLASAAQAALDFDALANKKQLSADDAYAQSKLALIMWSIEMADNESPTIIAVNPKSFLGSKMVQTAYGRKGFDLQIGADVLREASLSSKFENASGKYYDNDNAMFAEPHPYPQTEI